MELNICHIYPDVLNLYGDRGNITCMTKRLSWRGIDVHTDPVCIGDKLDAAKYDLFFIGGGQDFEQEFLLRDLAGDKTEQIRSAIEDGKTFLAICGGYQMLGHYYKNCEGETCEFIGALNLYTEESRERLIGDYAFSFDEIPGERIVGFENHSGRTYLCDGVEPLGTVLKGHGNNGADGTEGARYKNVYASYSHGCLLPKNPVLCDYILETALRTKYGKAELAPLDDKLENLAHEAMLKRLL